MHQYLDKQADSFLKEVFDKFADSSDGTFVEAIKEHTCTSTCTEDDLVSGSKSKFKGLMSTDGLQGALRELGAPVERQKVKELMVLMDLDENGGLDFEEFKRAVQQPPTQLEQWAGMLPLAGMLARSLPVSGSQGDQPLRDFSRLSEFAINIAVEALSDGLKRLLKEAQATARCMFDSVDKKASEASKDSAVSKFTTFKMSTGTVQNYHKGLADRIGAFLCLSLDA